VTEKLKLHTLLADYPSTHAIRSGELTSPLIDFDFAPVEVANTAFKPFVRERPFDAGELAIATFLQAVDHGKKLTLLPITIQGRFQHHCIAYNVERGALAPGELSGKRVGVRAYTQTTGMWVRGILQNQYGVDLDSISWLTFEDAHVREYRNPSNVELASESKKLQQMLLDGELDAAMLGSDMPDDKRLKTVIPDPEAAAKLWYADTGAIPVNHVFVVKTEIAAERPELMRELVRLFRESKARANLKGTIDVRPMGFSAIRPSIELAIEYCLQQKLISRRLSLDELYHPNTIGIE
jgi:4,5-dihydroxyphthalate decarboxylase